MDAAQVSGYWAGVISNPGFKQEGMFRPSCVSQPLAEIVGQRNSQTEDCVRAERSLSQEPEQLFLAILRVKPTQPRCRRTHPSNWISPQYIHAHERSPARM